MIPFNNLKEVYSSTISDELKAISSILESAHYVLGPHVEEFEQRFAELHGCSYGVACSSGTAALHLALAAHEFELGKKVVVPNMTFVATASAVRYSGLVPLLVDVDEDGLMDVELLESLNDPEIVAILPVNLHGQATDIDRISAIVRKKGWIWIEDAAQAHGLQALGAGKSLSSASCFSFYPGKNLGAAGEAGIVLTNSEGLARNLRVLRDWGAKEKYRHDKFGFNYRMDAIQGAVLGIRLKRFSEWQGRREEIAALYAASLKGVNGIKSTRNTDPSKNSFHIYSLFSESRDRLQEYLLKKEIQTGLHYPIPINELVPYSSCEYIGGSGAKKFAETQLSLPLFGTMTNRQAKDVIDTVLQYAEITYS